MSREFNVRLFKAVDDLQTCMDYLEGHRKVLQKFGIGNITTNNARWFEWESVFVIVIECSCCGVLVGGIRIQKADGINPLPLEDAVGPFDPAVYKYVRDTISEKTTGELCGLWSSKAVAGMGISTILMKSGIAVSTKLGLNSLLTLSADYTNNLVFPMGFVANRSFANEGNFTYPNENYIARISEINDLGGLSKTKEKERREIVELRKDLFKTTEETGSKGKMIVNYNLSLAEIKHRVAI